MNHFFHPDHASRYNALILMSMAIGMAGCASPTSPARLTASQPVAASADGPFQKPFDCNDIKGFDDVGQVVCFTSIASHHEDEIPNPGRAEIKGLGCVSYVKIVDGKKVPGPTSCMAILAKN
jgi:hypothetical protein